MRARTLGLLGALALAGCDDGIVIEVRTPGATDEVELFLGIEECHDCPGVSPSGETGAVPLPGRVFFRDDSSTGAHRYVARASGGRATFHVKPSALGDTLVTLAAFAHGQTVAATLVGDVDLVGGPQHLILELAPVTAALPTPVPPDGSYAVVWEQANTSPASACFAFERWANQEFQGRAFIVPKDDPDCDGFRAGDGECNPYVPNSAGEPELGEDACLIPELRADATKVCRIGGPACRDGANEVEACAPTSYCVPNAVCANCVPTDPVGSCAQAFAAATPRLVCTLPMRRDSAGTVQTPCPEAETFAVDLGADLGTACVDDDTPLVSTTGLTTHPPSFASEITFLTGDAIAQRELTLKLKHEDRCTYRFAWYGDTAAGAEERVAFARFEVSPEGRPATRLFLPLEVRFTGVASCGDVAPTCAFVRDSATPDLFGCLAP